MMALGAKGRRMARMMAVAATGALASCGNAGLILQTAEMSGKGEVAAPPILAEFDGAPPVETADNWRERRAPLLRRAFQEHVYGFLPDRARTQVTAKRLLDDAYLDGRGRLEEWRLRVGAAYGAGDFREGEANVLVLTPAGVDRPRGVVLMETFCASSATTPHPDVSRYPFGPQCEGGGFGSSIMFYFFGRYIARPPLEEMLERGYALATVFPSEFVPDASEAGLAALERLTQDYAGPADARLGAIGAWGWFFSRMIDALEDDGRFDGAPFVTYGHSRYGKSALVAGAYDNRVAAVIAHQSGTGGAALNRRKKGESITDITESYPHWFAPKYASYGADEGATMPIDQHQLIALIAPRPVLIGNAKRDVWSDPNGSYRASVGADPVYELLGSQGLEQESLRGFEANADLAFHIRSGTHGVTEDDWPAFFAFLDAHLPEPGAVAHGDEDAGEVDVPPADAAPR